MSNILTERHIFPKGYQPLGWVR